MGAIEANKETLKRFSKLIEDFNIDLEKLEEETGFYVNLDMEQFQMAGTLRRKTNVRAREVCIY